MMTRARNQAAMRPSCRPPSRRRALVALLVGVLRVLAMVSIFQLSGAGHLGGDLVAIITTGHHPDEGPEDENDPNHECPPGCPTCHHVHYSGASLPADVALPLTWVPLTEGVSIEWRPGASPQRIPIHSSVYRPPRT